MDVDGDPRLTNGAVDIGADEFSGRIWPAQTHIVRVSKSGSDSNDGSSWDTAMLTVGAALEAIAPTGGEVWVGAGVYTERVYVMEYISLYGGFAGTENAPDERRPGFVTTLDGGKGGSVVTLSGSGSRCAVDGFTVRNGLASYGGGILCMGYGAAPLIQGNTIIANSAPEVEGSDALHNGYGGGIFCDWRTAPRIVNNDIVSNTAAYGGGIYTYTASTLIERNAIHANTAASGGGLYIESATNHGDPITSVSVLRNNVIWLNTASYSNACAMSVAGDLILTAVNNTFVANKSTAYGKSIAVDNGPIILFANNILTGSADAIVWYKSTLDFRGNCVFANTGMDYAHGTDEGVTNEDYTGRDGNIRADPMFVNAASADYHLRNASPCVNAGDDTVDAGVLDMDGEPRRQGSRVDIGADETSVAGLTMADAASALAVAGGLAAAPPDASRLDVAPSPVPDGNIRLEDAAAIARKVSGLD
jgi:hypothetical protein